MRILSIPSEHKDVSEKSLEKTTQEGSSEVVVKARDRILHSIIQNPLIPREALSQETRLCVRGVELNLSELKKDGRIRRIGPDKGGHWEVLS